MTQKPPPIRHRFRLKDPTQTPSGQTRNPIQPDAKPPPTRQAKRSKRINRSAGRPLEAATTESNNEQSESVYNLDRNPNLHMPIVGNDGLCIRCAAPAQPGVACESNSTTVARKQPADLLDYTATQVKKCEEQIRLSEYAYERRLPYGGRSEQ